MIKVDLSGVMPFLNSPLDFAGAADGHGQLFEHRGAGSEFTGWIDLPQRIEATEL